MRPIILLLALSIATPALAGAHAVAPGPGLANGTGSTGPSKKQGRYGTGKAKVQKFNAMAAEKRREAEKAAAWSKRAKQNGGKN